MMYTVFHKVRNLKLKLCEISGVTANDLLSGKETDMKGYEKKADKNLIVLNRKDKNNRTANVMISIIFSATLLIGITVCLICNIAISGSLTWSLIPVSSIDSLWLQHKPLTFRIHDIKHGAPVIKSIRERLIKRIIYIFYVKCSDFLVLFYNRAAH